LSTCIVCRLSFSLNSYTHVRNELLDLCKFLPSLFSSVGILSAIISFSIYFSQSNQPIYVIFFCSFNIFCLIYFVMITEFTVALSSHTQARTLSFHIITIHWCISVSFIFIFNSHITIAFYFLFFRIVPCCYYNFFYFSFATNSKKKNKRRSLNKSKKKNTVKSEQ
jgi:hypothetical protein